VSAMIDGRGPVTLVLDTGADRTMISPAALARLGIAPPGTLRTRVSGVTGSSTADLVRVESVRVGDAMVGPLVLIAHDAGLPQADGLLGRDFLAAFTVTIDTRAGLVTLAPE
jgi:predicted aspartyl protease